jgi:hypothetical protein
MDDTIMTDAIAASADDTTRLLGPINANWMAQAIRTACLLRLPEEMAGAPQRASGRERGYAELKQLFSAAGLALGTVDAVDADFSILQASRC